MPVIICRYALKKAGSDESPTLHGATVRIHVLDKREQRSVTVLLHHEPAGRRDRDHELVAAGDSEVPL